MVGGLRIMGHHDDGLAELSMQRLKQRQDLIGRRSVEIAGRLIADQQARIGNQRPRDGDPLLLATGELA